LGGEKSKNPITQSVMLPLVRPFGFQSKIISIEVGREDENKMAKSQTT